MNQPQDLYQIVQAGGNAKAFLLALHKRNTGGLSLSEIRQEIWEQQTQMIPTIPKSPPLSTGKLIAQILAPTLQGVYVDQDGRQCLKLIDVAAHTLELVDAAVERFRKLTGSYPVEIIPCPSRYVLLKFKDFAPNGASPIPYIRDFSFPIDYDILVRGGKVNG
jgi:hypothetical protein